MTSVAARSAARQPRRAIGHDGVAVPLEVQQSMRIVVVQVVVRLVQQNAVRQPGPLAKDVQRRQHRANVVNLLVVRTVREVDHDAPVWVAEGAQQLARRRRRVLAARAR